MSQVEDKLLEVAHVRSIMDRFGGRPAYFKRHAIRCLCSRCVEPRAGRRLDVQEMLTELETIYSTNFDAGSVGMGSENGSMTNSAAEEQQLCGEAPG